jgi:hypothetical protein
MQSELERNQPFASVVVRVSKFYVYEVQVRFALIAGPNPDTDPLRSPRAAMPVRSTRFAAYRTNACPSLKLDRCNDDGLCQSDRRIWTGSIARCPEPGIGAASRAKRLYSASLVTTEATVRALLAGSPNRVSLVAMGDNGIKRTDEDELCGIHLRSA